MILRCTVRGCGERLDPAPARLVCPNGHAFDRAREGYVALLQPQDKKAAGAGDRDEAVAARRRWLARGFADGLVAAIAEESSVEGPAIDVGCGEGTITARLFGRRDEAYGVDLSVRAIRRAARLSPRIVWVVANADRGLPFADESAALAVSIFGRRPVAELRRVLRAGGTLLVVVPAEDDLVELREAAQGGSVRRDRVQGVLAEMDGAFTLRARRAWRHQAHHDRAAIDDALAMSYRGARHRERARLEGTNELTITLSAEILVLA